MWINCHDRFWFHGLTDSDIAALESSGATELPHLITVWVHAALNKGLLSLSNPPDPTYQRRSSASAAAPTVVLVTTFVSDAMRFSLSDGVTVLSNMEAYVFSSVSSMQINRRIRNNQKIQHLARRLFRDIGVGILNAETRAASRSSGHDVLPASLLHPIPDRLQGP